MSYLPRVIDGHVDQRLRSAGALLIEGPKACGKTWTAQRMKRSSVLLDVDDNARAALQVDPSLVLAGETPRLVDEWQLGGSKVWNHVRRTIDERQAPGQFILTGSATPADDVVRHSGAGRFATIRMRPMCLHEVGAGSGEISLAGLLSGQATSCPDPGLTFGDLVECVVRGGWPRNLLLSVEDARTANVDYLAQAREVDIPTVEGVRRDPARLERLLQSIARNVATEAKIATLASGTSGGDEAALARSTIYDYLSSLERLMLIENVPAWSPHLRSRATLRKEAKLHFVDPSLAVAALRASPDRLRSDLNYLGFLFESMVVRDLRVLSGATGARLFHYRDSNRVEADIIVQEPDGRWSVFEVKLGAGAVDEGAAQLTRFIDTIDLDRVGSPVVAGVITNATYGYVRPDGIHVIPIGALAP